jgi:integrase
LTVYFHKPRGRWVFNFVRGGQRYSGYCLGKNGAPVTSKRAAEEAEGVEKRKVDIAPKLPRASDLTLAQVVADLLPAWEQETNWCNKRVYVREIVAFFGEATPVAAISEARIDDFIAHELKQPVMLWTGGATRDRAHPDSARFWKPSGRTRNAATVNRYLPVLRAIFNRAWKTRDPITNERALSETPEFADLPEPKRKARPIPDGVLSHVIGTLPDHVREAVVATLLFGFRRSEIFRLELPEVDFELGGVWLSHARVKDDEDSFMPGSPEAMAFMRQLVDQAVERGQTRLITWRRKRAKPEDQVKEPWRTVESPKAAWRTAMKRVVKAFGRRYRWHDIRAAYISLVATTSGGPAAKRLARHSDYRTTEAYIHIEDDALRVAAQHASARPALAIVRSGTRIQDSHTASPAAPRKSSK